MAAQGGHLGGDVGYGGSLAAFLGEAQAAQQAAHFGQPVAFAHKAPQHFVDAQRFRRSGNGAGAPQWYGGVIGRDGRGSGIGVGLRPGFGVFLHGHGHGFHHTRQVVGEHTAPVHEVVAAPVGQPHQLVVAALHQFRHWRHGKGGEVGQRAGAAAAQMGGEERRNVLGQVRGHRQGDDVGAVHIVRLGVHAEVQQRVSPGPQRVADFKMQFHRCQYRLDGRQ